MVRYIGCFSNDRECRVLGFTLFSEKGLKRKLKSLEKRGWFYDSYGGHSQLRKVDKFPSYLSSHDII